MKLYKKIALACSVVIASSCTLDLREDPNAVQPSQVLPSLILNSMQRNLAVLFDNASGNGRALTRLVNAGSSTYRQSITPEGFNGFWSSAYASILNDADQLIKLGQPLGYARHTGIAKIIQAYTLVTLVDSFGDVPFSQAFKGDGNFNPGVDGQAALYAKAIVLLDSAKLDLTTLTTTSSPPGYQSPIAPDLFDLYYGNGATTPTTTFTKWLRLANTLKLKIYLNQRLNDPTGSTAAIDALIADVTPTGFLISNANENFIFRYGTTTADPDARHPSFVGQYPNGGGDYQSNWLIWHMFHGYDAIQRGQPGDPRIRFYMYRQTSANSTSTNELRCLSESPPSHYPGSTGSAIIDNAIAGRAPMGVGPGHPTNDPLDPAWNRTFCVPTDRGYWGRDHLDPQGIPPDGQLRTAYGPYPVGGRFDNNTNVGVTAAQGMAGAGFQPIMMRSYVSFMLAEAQLYLGVAGLARTYYDNGISQSLDDVRAWAINGTFGTSSVAAAASEGTVINSFYPAAFQGALAASVVAATTANLSALTGTLTVDGVSLIVSDRVLVKNQTTASANGIYVVAAGPWTRALDADTGAELNNMAVVSTGGSTNGTARWLQTTATPTVGTSSIVWVGNFSYNDDKSKYIVSALAAFDACLAGTSNTNGGTVVDETMNYIAREYWIALYGNGVEAMNLYRRTGMPTGMQPVLNPASGPFPRSYWYPANFANLNNTVDQKADLTTRVFWDTSTSNLDF